jgi:ABC-type transport system substrate-binding protein
MRVDLLGERQVIDYRLLGPLEVACDGRALDLGGRKQRILPASLPLHANQPVHRDVLILNDAEFCDLRIDAQTRRAMSLEQADPAQAAARWASVDRELTSQAPWVPMYNPRDLTVLSARVGNYEFHPYWNVLIDQLWVG